MKTVKDKLYNYEEIPPAEIWNKISDELNQHNVVPINNRTKTRRIALFTAAAAVAALLIITLVVNKKDYDPNSSPVQIVSAAVLTDSVEKNNKLLEAIINAPENQKLSTSAEVEEKGYQKYFTVEGPEGLPVKISPKVATLILSANNGFPPKPVWDKKISEWQHIMLTNSLSASPANLMDLIQEVSSNSN